METYLGSGIVDVKFTLVNMTEDEIVQTVHDYTDKINEISPFFKVSDIIYDFYPMKGTIRNAVNYKLGKINKKGE